MASQQTTIQITMPAMGESVNEGVVLEWRKQVGDRVELDEPLVEISTDKVDAEVPSPAAGVLTSIAVGPDETVKVGAVLGEIEVGGEPAGESSGDGSNGEQGTGGGSSDDPSGETRITATMRPQSGSHAGTPSGDSSTGTNGGGSTAVNGGNGAANATPVAARMAAELGLDVTGLDGSGPRGRVTKADVLDAAAAAVKGGGAQAAPSVKGGGPAPTPSAPAPPDGAEAKQIRGPAATLVRFMEESRSIPTATSFRTLAVDALATRRAALKAAGRKLSFTHLIAWAIVRATDDMPVMAHSFAAVDGKPHRVTPPAVSLGLAVDVERKDGTRSLVVPVIHAASTLSFPDFVAAYDAAVAGARDNTLAPDAYAGANVTLTNPGGIGTVASVPRLMPGQGTIVATGAIGYPPGLAQADPRRLEELGVAKVMTMTSTYDHRVIQGAESGQFLARVDELLQGADGFYDDLFAALGIDPAQVTEGPPSPAITAADPAPASTTPAVSEVPDEALMQAVQAATSVIKAHRVHGHLAAQLDPLGTPPRGDPALDPESVNLTQEMMERIPASILRVAVPGKTFADALPHLRETYTGTIAYEVEHIAGHNRRVWLRENIESGAHRTPLSADGKRDLLARLSRVEALENYLHKAYLGKKQFSIEGLDMLVPMLDETIELCSESGAREAVLGMAHRGRLNVLAHTVNQPYETILVEFEGEQTLSADTAAPEGGTGDVKYHYGASGTYKTRSGKDVQVTLSPNPSHLEYVNPVIEGRARADQTNRDGREISHDPSRVVPILIHGDAAFPGQGIVAETLNLQALSGYSTGGTVHIIANNQLGFTTDPDESRSTRWASDLAKGFDIPIIHVNADDVEACIAAVRLAVGFRNEFGRDALIDLIGYRRFGHNETDEPAYTQPQMYERIKKQPSVRAIYAKRLVAEGVISAEDAERMATEAHDAVGKAHKGLKESMAGPPETGAGELDTTMSREPKTTLPADLLRSLNEQIVKVPEGFAIHRKLKPFLERRRAAAEPDGTVDWAHAEALAFASLLALGVPVRLTGQDSERGTFSQRHLVLHDTETGDGWCPLQNLQSASAPFELHNSPLSEQACLGFEYGYSIQDPDALVLWEAQFGDFVNSGQVILDQFMTSGLAKWGLTSRLTLLLPHGYEGSGPEHSSGRVERFLQACAEGNIRVANATTPAQYFHLLRRQALVGKPRPLVIMTPKSLLRLPAATSTLDELASGEFHRVIDDPLFTGGGGEGNGSAPKSRDKVTKLVLCSGKVYYDIVGHEERPAADHIAVARVEMLYPFPEAQLKELMESYPSLERVVWVQEEPRNMGPRAYMRRRMAGILPEHLHYYYVGRQLRAAQSEGYTAAHRKEQARIVRVALDLEDDVLRPDRSAERPKL
ncbi:MAG TPA: multifunctional oxoglutarate decarboxylase/oxoglutarate dehydrogenase thiamine pyrophosphate-binding subunit/dihydrolipoyllysine-residue succinyltransferase subunit [Thermoleophilaceae bacterium]|nr:multifunctional oxoglutarate decarboxylase/oxoglutarate dehydrogenase thiamine pyrophosphate-binding subunit/dihydrolipoyllysine-residue succinyltransferase subunit [Thermoleophilaceae bacterium]